MNRFTLLAIILLSAQITLAGNKIKYFFTQPVNTSVSKGVNAQYLNNCLGDTIVAYINRAKYTLDIAVYNYTSTFPAIAVAVNNAVNVRGVKVRWIYDTNQSNTGIPLLNSSVKRLASPDATTYGIMHNKFMVIDANSSNPADAIVWTGSSNWNAQQFNDDYNNAVVLQDQALAKAYRAHFNMMWGDTGMTPNITLAKFGSSKTDLGAHSFVIDGVNVELYFSPADNVNAKIQAAINSANTDMYVGMSTFTYNSNASMLVTKHATGVYVAAIADPSSSSSSVISTLSSGLGSMYKTYPGSELYHNKFMIVDASNTCSDPLVLTGSHNWSVSADTKNDENTLIIHDATAANIYYQSFYANFTSFGGSLTAIADCTADVPPVTSQSPQFSISPNPARGAATLQYHLAAPAIVSFSISDITGRQVSPVRSLPGHAGSHNEEISFPHAGVFIVRIVAGNESATRLITVE